MCMPFAYIFLPPCRPCGNYLSNSTTISQIPQLSLKFHNYLSNTTILINVKIWIESKVLPTSCKVLTLAVCDRLQTNSPVGALVRAPPLLCAGFSGRIAEGYPLARRHQVLSDPQRRLVTQRLISKRVAGEVSGYEAYSAVGSHATQLVLLSVGWWLPNYRVFNCLTSVLLVGYLIAPKCFTSSISCFSSQCGSPIF
jgi:hypothetical protein